MDDLTSRFLDAHTAIEKWLKSQVDADRRRDFLELVDGVSALNYSVHRHNTALKELNRFRNVVVHNYSRGRPLAAPTTHAVELITAIRKELLSPPLLLPLAATPVAHCRPSDPLGCCVKKMHDGVFSQLPVYEGNEYVGLLTAETIARWLATEFVGDWKGIVDERSVAEVMRHQESSENSKFLAARATVADAMSAFDDFQHRGKRLEAILITSAGSPSEPLRGIVTIHDIPKLNKAING